MQFLVQLILIIFVLTTGCSSDSTRIRDSVGASASINKTLDAPTHSESLASEVAVVSPIEAPKSVYTRPLDDSLDSLPQHSAANSSPQSQLSGFGIEEDASTGGTWVRIRADTNVTELSKKYTVSERSIIVANNLQHNKKIVAGTKILIPSHDLVAQGLPNKPKEGTSVSYNNADSAKLHSGAVSANSNPRTNNSKLLNIDNIAPSKPMPVRNKSLSPDASSRSPLPVTPDSGVAASTKRIEVNHANRTNKPDASNESSSSFMWPVIGRVIKDFGNDVVGHKNDGIDISVPMGADIRAAEKGEVIYAGSELKEYGNMILIRHSDGWVSAYANASKLLVQKGDAIERGQVIAKAGATGSAKQSQLHFELRKQHRPVDPKKHLPATN